MLTPIIAIITLIIICIFLAFMTFPKQKWKILAALISSVFIGFMSLIIYSNLSPIGSTKGSAKYACMSTERDAKKIEAIIEDYFVIPGHTTVPNFDQLRKWSSVTLTGKNTATIIGADPYEPIIIMIKDGSEKCPVAYQNVVPGWDGHGVYKLTMSLR